MRWIGGAIAVILLAPLLIMMPMVAASGPIAPASQIQVYQDVAATIDGLAWQELMALAAVLTDQDLSKMTRDEIEDLAHLFCESEDCRTLHTLDEVMEELGLTQSERDLAHELLDSLTLLDGLIGAQLSADTPCAEGEWEPNKAADWRWPVPGYYTITSCYGLRVDPVYGTPGAMHAGLDIGAAIGTPVVAARDGEVIEAGWAGVYGLSVVIDHGLLGMTRYAHMDEIKVSKGQRVRVGEVIGTVGNTGKSTGPHLHFEWIVDGRTYDPINLYR